MAVTPDTARALRWPLRLTRAGLAGERAVRAFWPLWSVLALALAWALWGVALPEPWARGLRGGAALAGVLALGYGLRRFRWPTRGEALRRLEARMPGRPLSALADSPAIGGGALWQAHQARMAEAARGARAPRPDLRVSARDPFGLRYMALIALVMAALFGSGLRVASGGAVVPGPAGGSDAPQWEGWAEPPRYSGKPALYLNDQQGDLRLPQGTVISFRFYGEAGALQLEQSVADADADLAGPTPRVTVATSGQVAVAGPGGRAWGVAMIPDHPPEVTVTGPAEGQRGGGFSLPFEARDDYGVRRGRAEIRLDPGAVERAYGLAVPPEPREALVLDLPMPLGGDRSEVIASLADEVSTHPFANLPVTVVLWVEDEAGQGGDSAPFATLLPGKRFFQPFAAAVAEQRRDLLWSRQGNGVRVAQVLRALVWGDEALFAKPAHRAILRAAITDLEAQIDAGFGDEAAFEALTTQLWDLALELEEGALEDARARLERARERLAEAMRNGASAAEIADLMEELRRATDAYMDLLAQQAEPAESGIDQPDQGPDERQTITMQEIQRLMDEIQQLMEEGRMEEAAALMEQLNALLDNLQFEQGEGGEGRRSMEQMGEALRDQQDLSDDAFRALQDRFNGRDPQTGDSQPRQPGDDQSQPGDLAQPGEEEADSGEGAGGPQSLAERQRALREALEGVRDSLPGLTGEAAEAAREALERAGDAMEDAAEALEADDLPGAIDGQGRALEALREAMDQFAQAVEEQGSELSDEAASEGEHLRPGERDPLGRRSGSDGGDRAAQEGLGLPAERRERARELLDDLRRRLGEVERPRAERDYLERLLERF